MDDENKLDLQKLLDIFDRRKGLILAVFVVIFSLGVYLAVILPDIYRSSALIRFVPQELPNSYVQSTVIITMQERINAIANDILSRSRLERIIREFNLYPELTGSMKERRKKMRGNIRVEADETESVFGLSFDEAVSPTFELSYDSRSPAKAQEVAARLALVFVDETMKLRTERATATTVFIKTEADRLKQDVEKQETKVNLYKAKYRYDLPERLQANLIALEQLRNELQNNILRLSSLRDSKANLEKELLATRNTGGEKGLSRMDQADTLRTELETLLSRYSHRHPDVIRLKQEIKAIEAAEQTQAPKAQPVPPVFHLERDPVKKMLLKQIQDLKTETKSLHAKNKILRDKITVYQARVDNTSTRAIQLSKITRTYEVTQQKYEDLLRKLLESKLSESMEKKKKATRFQILEHAGFPSNPEIPNRPLILVMGFIAALVVGFGLSFLMENFNTTFRNADELNAEIDLPLLASIPAIKTRGMILEKRRQQAVAVMLCLGTIGLGGALIRFYSQYIY